MSNGDESPLTLRLSPAEVDGGAGAVAHQEGTCAGHFSVGWVLRNS